MAAMLTHRKVKSMPQICGRLLVCGKEYAEVCNRKNFCCRLAAYQYATGTVCGRSAAGWNFAADLPHTSMHATGTDLRQICGRMKLCSILAAYPYATGTVCGRSATEKWGNYTVCGKAIGGHFGGPCNQP